jgi:pectate lyase
MEPTDLTLYMDDVFSDGERSTQALPDSAAWFTSSGSGNLAVVASQLRQLVSSSRTFLAYFTADQGTQVALNPGETLKLDFDFSFTGFDSAATVTTANFRVGLLRSLANPAAVVGANGGFVPSGPPNTNARMSGDFGSSSPDSHAFLLYSGYAAFTHTNSVTATTPIRFYSRSGPSDNLLGTTSSAVFTEVPVGMPTASTAMAIDTPYHGTLSLERTATTNVLIYTVTRVSDSVVMMSHSVVDAAAAMSVFDTAAFYLLKTGASPTYTFVLSEVKVSKTTVGPLTYPLTLNVSGPGSVAADPSPGPYAPGTVVTLTATPTDGNLFVGWSGNLTGSTNPTTITMDAAKSVSANFAPAGYTLTVNKIGSGSVGRFGYNTPVSTYPAGTALWMTALPAAGWSFAGWSGDLAGLTNPAQITLSANRIVTATFTPDSGTTPDFGLYGWAATNGGTTGGSGGAEVVVSTIADLRHYAHDLTEPYVVKISGTISGNEVVRVRSNKSILGIGSDARLLGVGLQVGWNSEFGQIHNVIIRNIAFEKMLAPIDGVAISYGAHNVWVDHCDFSSDRDHGIDFYDGLLDINHGADFITVSWTRFHDHYKTSLVGNSENTGDEDAGHLTVTYHHNSFITSGGRNPSVRFGLVHVYNNYYFDLDDYGVASRINAQVVIENNWFENVIRPIRADTSLSDIAGFVRGEATNTYVNSGANSIITPPATWVPPYPYALDPVANVPGIVGPWSGVGVLTFRSAKRKSALEGR